MSTLAARLRAEIDEDVNEPLDRLLAEAADRIEALENWIAVHRDDVLSLSNEAEQSALEVRQLRRELAERRRPDPTPDKINEAFKRATRV
jgi:phage shock protein A